MNYPPNYAKAFSKLNGVKSTGLGWGACCPSHDDKHASLSLKIGDNGALMMTCHANAGCTFDSIRDALGLTVHDCFPPDTRRTGGHGMKEIATYDYRDENRKLLFQAVRFEPKDFRQRRPVRPEDDASKARDGWVYSMQGVRRVLYNLPELKAADPGRWVFIVEGEKDVETLTALGFMATTSPMGAGKWKEEYSKSLAGRNVVVVPDYDLPHPDTGISPGWAHVVQVVESLNRHAKEIRILSYAPPGVKWDITNYCEGNQDAAEQIKARAAEAKPVTTLNGLEPYAFSLQAPADSPSADAKPAEATNIPEPQEATGGPDPVEVMLDACDMATAAKIGASKAAAGIFQGAETGRDPWQTAIEQVCGTMAVAKHLGRYWTGGLLLGKGGVQLVVCTRAKSEQELYLLDDSASETIHFLVTGTAPRYQIRGWIKGDTAREVGKKQKVRGKDVVFVPTAALTGVAK